MPSLLPPDELPPGSLPPPANPPRTDEEGPLVVEGPHLPPSPRRPQTPSEAPRPQPAPSEPSPPQRPSSATSSASEGAAEAPRPPAPRPAAPEDVAQALRDGVDIALECVMGGAEALHRRTVRHELAPDAWRPTDQERQRVIAPASRIIRRHVSADVADVDTIDAALIGTALLTIAVRSARTPKTTGGPADGSPAS